MADLVLGELVVPMTKTSSTANAQRPPSFKFGLRQCWGEIRDYLSIHRRYQGQYYGSPMSISRYMASPVLPRSTTHAKWSERCLVRIDEVTQAIVTCLSISCSRTSPCRHSHTLDAMSFDLKAPEPGARQKNDSHQSGTERGLKTGELLAR